MVAPLFLSTLIPNRLLCDPNHISNLGIVHFKEEIPRLNESGKEVFFKELHCKLWQYIHI